MTMQLFVMPEFVNLGIDNINLYFEADFMVKLYMKGGGSNRGTIPLFDIGAIFCRYTTVQHVMYSIEFHSHLPIKIL